MATYSITKQIDFDFTAAQEICLGFFISKQYEGGFIECIKFLRAEFAIGLKEAKDLADRIFGRS